MIHKLWMRLWGWHPSVPAPKFINDVSTRTPLKGHRFDRLLTEKFCAAEFDVVVEVTEGFFGTPIVGPRPTRELQGLSAFL